MFAMFMLLLLLLLLLLRFVLVVCGRVVVWCGACARERERERERVNRAHNAAGARHGARIENCNE